MRLISAILAAVMLVTATASNAAMTARDGQVFYRYAGGPTGIAAPDSVSPYDADVTARFVGVSGFAFSEKIPLVPGKSVKRWQVVDGEIPEGIVLDANAGTFSGTPESPLRGLEVYLQGFGADGKPNAIAQVTFDIFQAQDQVATVDFYGHTNKYRLEKLPVPNGVTVDRWHFIFSPPPGVDVVGRNFDGTPTTAGRYPVAVQGFDYLNREVILFTGYYTVEDGPTFPEVADDVRPIDPLLGVEFFNLAVPSIRVVAENPAAVEYEVELDVGESLPGTVRAIAQSGTLIGDVYFPYDTARVRYKATDVDGTVGYSNWFTFGTSFPSPDFAANPMGPFYGVVGQPFNVLLNTLGSAGDKTFSVVSGALPEGLELDPKTGLISGTPEVEGEAAGIVIEMAVANAGNVDTTQSQPFSIIVDADEVGIEISAVQQPAARSMRLFSTMSAPTASSISKLDVRRNVDIAVEVKPVGAVIEPATIDIDPRFPLPDGLSYDPGTGMLSGSIANSGDALVRFVLTNGNGKKADASLNVATYNELSVNEIADLYVSRYDTLEPSFPIVIDPKGVVPAASGSRFADVEVIGNLPAGITYSAIQGGLVGGTTDPEGVYGPVSLSVTDGSGENVSSNEFFVHVMPRKTISVSTKDVVTDITRDTVDPILSVVRPPLSKDLPVSFELAAGTLPSTLSVEATTGKIVGLPAVPGVYEGLRIKATDGQGFSGTSLPFKLTVNEAGPLSALPRDEVKVAIDTPAAIEASKFAFVVGNLEFVSATGLPVGLEMASNGLITGTPTELVDRATVTVNVRDGANRTASASFKISVVNKPTLAFEAATSPLSVAQYETKSWKLKASNIIGTPTLSISNGTLPVGFKLFSTGLLSGSTDVKGTFTGLRATVTDSATGLTAELPFSIVVGDRKATTLSYPNPSTVFTNAFTAPISPKVNNAKGAVSYQLLSGQLPAGLVLDPQTGMISGSAATTGWYRDIAVRATDSENVSGQTTFDILVTRSGAIGFAKIVDFRYRAGEAFTTPPVPYSNVVLPLRYSLLSSAPGGTLFDNATGRFSGQLSYVGTVEATVSAIDAHDRTPAETTKVRIAALGPLGVTAHPQNKTIYQFDKEATAIAGAFGNAVGDLQYSLQGTLPAGLAFNPSTGVITGKASETGTFANLRISAADAHDGSVATTNAFSITVLPRKPLTASLPSVSTTLVDRTLTDFAVTTVANDAYGSGVTYSVSGTLPAGVTFNTAKGTFSGKATVLGDYPNIRVTVTDAVGASVTTAPMTIRVVLNGEPIGMVVQDIKTHIGWTFETPAPVVTNSLGKINFYSYDLIPEIALNAKTGVMSGTFGQPYDFEFDLYVADQTARVTSDRLKVTALPNVRAIYPTVVSAPQLQDMTVVTPDVSYKVGSLSFAKADPAEWPAGLNLDPVTGAISGRASVFGSFPGLTVLVTDTQGSNTMTMSSNTFTINVSEFAGRPVIQASLSNWALPGLKFFVGTAGSFTPSVVDNIMGQPWNYPGTVYAINKTLPEGLSFDTQTGKISGTPTVAATVEGVVITVTSANGYSSSTNPFWLGVQPAGNMTVSALPTNVGIRPGTTMSFDAPVVTNAVGNLRFAKLQGDLQPFVTLNTSTGAMSISLPANLAQGTYTSFFAIYDDFGRYADFMRVFQVLGPASVSYTDRQFSINQPGSLTPTTGGLVAGTVFTISPALPAGLTMDPATGVISGTPTVAAPAMSYIVTMTDPMGAVNSAPFNLSVSEGVVAARYWRFQCRMASPILGSSSVYEVGFAEIDMLENGVNMTPAGSSSYNIFTDSVYNGSFSAGNAFDNNTSTMWATALRGDPADPSFNLTVDFGAGVKRAINEVVLQKHGNGVAADCLSWAIQSTDTLPNFTDVWTDSKTWTAPLETYVSKK